MDSLCPPGFGNRLADQADGGQPGEVSINGDTGTDRSRVARDYAGEGVTG